MEYYYLATRTTKYDEDMDFLCVSNQQMKKKEVFVTEQAGEFFVATIKSAIDKMDALVKMERTETHARDVIIKVPIEEYQKKKENTYKQYVLMSNMNETMKQLKAMEMLEKYADKDENIRNMMNEYKALQ